jgi:hypothetical protein
LIFTQVVSSGAYAPRASFATTPSHVPLADGLEERGAVRGHMIDVQERRRLGGIRERSILFSPNKIEKVPMAKRRGWRE